MIFDKNYWRRDCPSTFKPPRDGELQSACQGEDESVVSYFKAVVCASYSVEANADGGCQFGMREIGKVISLCGLQRIQAKIEVGLSTKTPLPPFIHPAWAGYIREFNFRPKV
jgi:hypothetical protein